MPDILGEFERLVAERDEALLQLRNVTALQREQSTTDVGDAGSQISDQPDGHHIGSHEGYRCDECHTEPIVGVRYTVESDDYDCCQACVDANKQRVDAKLLKVVYPSVKIAKAARKDAKEALLSWRILARDRAANVSRAKQGLLADGAALQQVNAQLSLMDEGIRYRTQRYYYVGEVAAKNQYVEKALAFASVQGSALKIDDQLQALRQDRAGSSKDLSALLDPSQARNSLMLMRSRYCCRSVRDA
eukprot:SAG31_NODE_528_length_14438_cov_2.252877_6_plen_246_part_00